MTHWKKLTNPDYLGSYAFEPGQEMTLTISRVIREKVIGADGKSDECIVCYFRENNVRPMILNSTNCKMITKLYRTPFIEEWAGKQITIRVEQVKAFGDVVDALRVKPVLPAKAPELKCTKCGQVLIGYGQMNARALADYTRKKFGDVLCAECAKKEADAKAEAEKPEEPAEEKTEENE